MEVNNIVMTGLGRSMSDLDCADGELSVSHNIIRDNGAMRPIWVPDDVMTLHDNEELVYVHRTSAYKNYIVSGREIKKNLIEIYYMYNQPLYFVFQYPTESELTIEIGYVLEAGEQWTSFTFPKGTYGKQERSVDGVLGTVTDLKFEYNDEFYEYKAIYVYNDENQIDNATWSEKRPDFGYGLHFFTDEDSERKPIVGSLLDDSMKISSIGNTLIITSNNGLEYALYTDGGYKYLGQKPPELNISWRLTLRRSSNGTSANAPLIEISDENIGSTSVNDEFQSETGVKVAAVINSMLANDEEQNRFTSTFFVRWAYRMYNGLYMASPPVMMPLNLNIAPTTNILDENGNDYTPDGSLTKFKLNVTYYNADLEYSIPDFITGVKSSLEDWSDIIDGVEFYVTRGITRYDQDGKVEGIEMNGYDERCISYGYIRKVASGGNAYARVSIQSGDAYRLKGMLKSEEDYINELKSASVFYKLKSYKLDELSGGNTVELEDGALKNLATSQVLSDETSEYLEHDMLYPDGVFVYNGRLNLHGVKSKKYNFPMNALSVYTNGIYGSTGDRFIDYYYNVRFLIGNEGETIEVTNVEGTYRLTEPPLYLFYPDNNAKKAIIERVNPDNTSAFDQAEVVLSSHPTLQGCYWFGGFDALTFNVVSESERLSEEGETRMVDNSGKIYTSEVNNPFVFPLDGINTIGTGRIVGISTATKALSQGQFGQFPLYVFSTEGVWAMEVESNGLYKPAKPVSRDVCINGDSITQTDDAVLFVTEHGVMLLDGSNVTCISDMMNGRSLDVPSIYGLGGLMKDGLTEAVDFMDYAREARMAYDYANGRIVLFRDDMGYCYVFSLTGKTWATLGMEIENAVTDYPDVYVQKGSGVKNLSTRVDYDSSGKVGTLIVTRPVKFGDDGYKTVYEAVSRGAMDRSVGALLLWGSHDGMEYVLIKSVRGNRIYRTGGSGYRYFRIGIVGSMCAGETLSMVSVGFGRKYTNRLR